MRDLVIADKSEIVNIADAVRSFTGSTTTMNLSEMKSHLNNTKTSIDNAFATLIEKGVTVPDGSTSDALAGLIASIEAGGGSVTSVTDDGTGNITINALYSFTFTDAGHGTLIGTTVSGTSSTDDSGNITII